MNLKIKEEIVPGELSKKQLIDSGMALVLILMIIGLFTGNLFFYKIAIPVLIVNMAIPRVFYPFAKFWFSLSNFLGLIVSRILLTIVYIFLVIPIGLFRRLFGNDNLYLKKFRKDRSSVLKTRDHSFTAKDIISPY